MNFRYELIKECKDTGARVGVFHTPHGPIDTPVYMPVGTQATVKSMTPKEVEELGAQIILSNTYHLNLRPGSELIKEAGGLHKFMHWDKAILTDSGGFQVFSLSDSRKISDDGVEFQSHIDGSRHFFSPERAVDIQNNLGADIIMCFDECIPAEAEKAYAKNSTQRTHLWAKRCQQHHKNEKQALFGICQGGMFEDLRIESANAINELDFIGNAIGGLSVGEPKPLMYDLLSATVPLLDKYKPRYLMGVGSPDALVSGVARGVDMFDCVMQTRMGRTAAALVDGGRLNLRNLQFRHDHTPIDEKCGCMACSNGFTKAYLRHLFIAGEILAARLVTSHNLYYTIQLMKRMREAILEDRFLSFSEQFLLQYP